MQNASSPAGCFGHVPADPHRLPGLCLRDHEFTVPLDPHPPHDSGGERITVFAREVVAPEKKDEELPYLVFLQGGPGYGAPRPIEASGWLGRALQEFRVLLVDQRGTGRSSPISHQSLARRGDAAAQASYLKHFRADGIVADCERIRVTLLGEQGKWTVLGQSYGGFCITHYLSAAPRGLAGVVLTGGLPPLTATCDEIYRRTYRLVGERNRRYYERYPEDVARVQEIAAYLEKHDVELPTGGPLSVRRFQQLGLHFGFSDGAEVVHYLVEDAFTKGERGRELAYTFRREFEGALHFDTNPIFSILHEAAYCQGFASRWSAERIRAEFPEFEHRPDAPLFFTGEMIYPWMFEEMPTLRPLRDAAELLAQDEDWPRLYDVDALRANEVPAVAAIYHDDIYVEREFSKDAAETIAGLRPWITNEYEHNGLRSYGDKVLDRLLTMLREG